MQAYKLIILALAVIAAIFIAYKYLNKTNNIKQEDAQYLKKGEVNGQEIYDKEKAQPAMLGLKNSLELSWQFLYEVTEKVMNKFNDSDKNMVNNIGKKLFNIGMRYNHVIEYGINYNKLGVSLNKNQTQKISK